MGTVCRVHLLGGFAVEVDGVLLPQSAWRHPDTGDLVALLAIEPTHRLRQIDVINELWAGEPYRDALRKLDKTIKGICKATHDKRAVTTEGDHLRLWPHGELDVDVHAFTARAKHAKRSDQRAAALAIYAGELLPDRREATWTEPIRTRSTLMYLELQRDPNSNAPAWIDLRDQSATRALAD